MGLYENAAGMLKKKDVCLRSACTYVGAGKIKEMPKRTTFIRCVLDISTVSQGISGGLVARFCCAVAR